MPFEVTEDVIDRVGRMRRREKRYTGHVSGLQKIYLDHISRIDAKQLAIRRLRVATGLFEHAERIVNSHKALFLAVIECAISDMVSGMLSIRAGKFASSNFRTAMTFFESNQFNGCCDKIGLDVDWAFSVVKDLYHALRNGAEIGINK